MKKEARATEPVAKPKATELPAGVPWSKCTPEMGADGISRLVASAMHQVYARRSAGPDQLMIEEGQAGGIWVLREAKPRGLAVFPYVQDLAQCNPAKRRSQTTPQVWLKVGDATTGFKLLPPKSGAGAMGEGASSAAGAGAHGEGASPRAVAGPIVEGAISAACAGAEGEGASPAATEAGAGATEEEATPPFVDMFWELYKRKGLGSGSWIMVYAEIPVPTSCFQIKEAAVRAGMGKAGNHVDLCSRI